MIQVKLKQPRAVYFPDGKSIAQEAGEIVDVSAEEAKRLVERNFAGYLEGIPQIETMTTAGERVETGGNVNTLPAESTDQVAQSPGRRRGRPRRSGTGEGASPATS